MMSSVCIYNAESSKNKEKLIYLSICMCIWTIKDMQSYSTDSNKNGGNGIFMSDSIFERTYFLNKKHTWSHFPT